MLPDVGLTELLVIALVALFVLKPEDVPGMMRKAGLLYVQARRFLQGFAAGLEEGVSPPPQAVEPAAAKTPVQKRSVKKAAKARAR